MPITIHNEDGEDVQLFAISELEEEVREEALDKHRDWNTGYDWWDFVYEGWKEKLETMGYDGEVEIQFSGFWSQGDGASFTSSLDVLKILERWREQGENTYEELRMRCWLGYIEITGRIMRHDSHYVHSNTIHADLELSIYEDVEPEIEDLLNNLVGQLEKGITEEARELSDKIYSDLEEEHDHLTSDEAIAESLESSEVLFDEEGEFWGYAHDVPKGEVTSEPALALELELQEA